MRIALVIQEANRRRGGAEGYTMDLAGRLARRGHEVNVVAEASTGGSGEQVEESTSFGVIRLGSRGATKWGRLRNFIERARELYASGEYDVVHAMLPVWRCDVYQPHSGLAAELIESGHLKHPGKVAQRVSRLTNRVNAKRQGLARVEREMLDGEGTRVLCFSAAMRDFAQRKLGVPEEQLVLLGNGVDLEKFAPPPPLTAERTAMRAEARGWWKRTQDEVIGLFVGNNWKLKGVVDAMEALAQANEKRIALVMVGRDDAKPYRRQAARLGVGGRVSFPGSSSQMRGLYAAADFLVLPTRRDTCSLVVLEALAMGLPVITTRQNGASEVMQQGQEGMIVERGDIGALTAALREMLDETRRREMAAAALAMRQRLSIETHVDRIEEVYRSVVAAKRGNVAVGR